MIGALNEYGALCTKVRARHGKRLRYDDLCHIAALDNLPAVLDYLRGHPGWSQAANFETSHLDRLSLESALRTHLGAEYAGLSAFIPRRDRPLFGALLRHAAAPPDYTVEDIRRQISYYADLYRRIRKGYTGPTRRILLSAVGRQVDLLNIIHILRLKQYFPGQDGYLTVLLPFSYRLKPEQLRTLTAAPDVEAAFQALEDTPYAGDFPRQGVAEAEDYYRRALYLWNRKELLLGPPSIYSAVAYFALRELELGALCTAIQSARYGAAYDDPFASLLQ